MSVISQKIDSARKASTPIPRLNEVLSEALRLIEKGLRAYVGSVSEAMIMEVETRRFSDILDAVSMPAMIGIAEVDGVDRAALVNIDLDLVYHIVDLRLGGLPTELPEFVARRPTTLDCNICSPVVDLVLSSFSQCLSESMKVAEEVPMRCTTFETLPMLASIAPERSDALYIQVSVDIGEAARSGNFELVIPFITLDFIKARLQNSETAATNTAGDAWAGHMLDSVLDTQLEVLPIIHSSRLSVESMSALKVGDVILLDPGADRSVGVHIWMGADRKKVAEARLGAVGDHKALKLRKDPDDTFLAPLRDKVDDTSSS